MGPCSSCPTPPGPTRSCSNPGTASTCSRRPLAGIDIEPLQTVDDTRRVAEVTFSGVDLNSAESLGGSAESTQRAVYAAQIALAADALGAAQKGLQIAVEYAKDRKQFERTIGSFQAVKHICAEVLAEVEPVESLLWHTADAWDEGSDET